MRWKLNKFMRRQLEGNHSYWWTPVLEAPPVVVESPVAAAPPTPAVQLESSQRTRAPSSYLQDLFCDLVNMYNLL